MNSKTNKWTQEILFVKRDENGVIVRISEQTPEDYYEEKSSEDTGYRIIGD